MFHIELVIRICVWFIRIILSDHQGSCEQKKIYNHIRKDDVRAALHRVWFTSVVHRSVGDSDWRKSSGQPHSFVPVDFGLRWFIPGRFKMVQRLVNGIQFKRVDGADTMVAHFFGQYEVLGVSLDNITPARHQPVDELGHTTDVSPDETFMNMMSDIGQTQELIGDHIITNILALSLATFTSHTITYVVHAYEAINEANIATAIDLYERSYGRHMADHSTRSLDEVVFQPFFEHEILFDDGFTVAMTAAKVSHCQLICSIQITQLLHKQ